MTAEWKKSMFDILDDPSGLPGCLTTAFCPCVTYGVILQHLKGAPESVLCAGKCLPGGCAFLGCMYVGCPCLLHIPTRQHVRAKYNIKPPAHGMLEDFLLTWFCGWCLLCQEYNEILLQTGGTTDYFTDLKQAATHSTKEVQAVATRAIDDAKAGKAKPAAEPEAAGGATAPKVEPPADAAGTAHAPVTTAPPAVQPPTH